MRARWLLLLVLLVSPFAGDAQSTPPPIVWHAWSDRIFAQAAREHKFVLLDLEAVWCHWCHVMDKETYSNPAVRRLMAKSYIAVKVDQDSRPDISNRYEDFGWPATVIFNADGGEIVKRQGYLPPVQMASILRAVIDDPSPGPSVEPEKQFTYAVTPYLAPALLTEVKAEFEKQYDLQGKGWAFGHKYLDADSVEYASVLAKRGDHLQQIRVGETLFYAQRLLDPVWGGAYQYSVGGDWDEPHFEKLLYIQAQTLRTYAQAYGLWQDAKYLADAENVHRYVRNFLTGPEGAFYVSQDADVVEGKHSADYFAMGDAKRRAIGIPRVDKHLYARENGWMIRSLCSLYAVTADDATLREAIRAARWVMAHRALASGGFAHGEHDVAGPFLGDTLAMGQAFLALYEVTGDREWLKHAEEARAFIAVNFVSGQGAGFVTSKAPTDQAYALHPERDENVQVARFATLLAQYSGVGADTEVAARAMKYLATREVAMAWLSAPILLAEMEFTHGPVHVTIEGSKSDSAARALFQTALRTAPVYRRVEWWDPAEGPSAREDVQYPKLGHAAAFLCTATACSSPITDAKLLQDRIAKAQR
ncbi:hypothetical protein SAMN05421770_11341 [Granulicella rosea]|uniref:Spermatogenesis-associated protein 20-like TRX domain-containing protein n=1 Tax=Granulicella rosea TaxID=474952 RepID=A0A239MHY8_9BACT|nr:DUF255 domain-containing protein [Granulicella rosea]SNT42271.1 hypothetical protein SAMN05421770_11341 [Granulicella rosea]